MLKGKDGDFFIADWLRNRNTIEYLGIGEKVHNPDFNYGEFAAIKNQAGRDYKQLTCQRHAQRANSTFQWRAKRAFKPFNVSEAN